MHENFSLLHIHIHKYCEKFEREQMEEYDSQGIALRSRSLHTHMNTEWIGCYFESGYTKRPPLAPSPTARSDSLPVRGSSHQAWNFEAEQCCSAWCWPIGKRQSAPFRSYPAFAVKCIRYVYFVCRAEEARMLLHNYNAADATDATTPFNRMPRFRGHTNSSP